MQLNCFSTFRLFISLENFDDDQNNTKKFKTLKKYEVKFKSNFYIFIITQDCYFQSRGKALRWFSFEVSVDY